jgi:hypothetical protein
MFMAMFGMPLFFVLSGFVIHYNYRRLFLTQPFGRAIYAFAELLSLGGRDEAAADVIKKAKAEFLLDVLDLPRQSRLSDTQAQKPLARQNPAPQPPVLPASPAWQ